MSRRNRRPRDTWELRPRRASKTILVVIGILVALALAGQALAMGAR